MFCEINEWLNDMTLGLFVNTQMSGYWFLLKPGKVIQNIGNDTCTN